MKDCQCGQPNGDDATFCVNCRTRFESGISPLRNLFGGFGCCQQCRTGCEEIRNLGAHQFRYYWHPLLHGELPCSYVFIAMEPTLPSNALLSEAAVFGRPFPWNGGFHSALVFAIDKFLLSEPKQGYFITNMAKCSMPHSLAQDTQEFRFETCATFLLREIELVGNGTCPEIVSIGSKPRDFIRKHRDLYGRVIDHRRVHTILHYSKIPWTERRFIEHRDRNIEAYREFCERWGSEYEAWLRTERPWGAQLFERDPQHDFVRLFKYHDQLTGIRRRTML